MRCRVFMRLREFGHVRRTPTHTHKSAQLYVRGASERTRSLNMTLTVTFIAVDFYQLSGVLTPIGLRSVNQQRIHILYFMPFF